MKNIKGFYLPDTDEEFTSFLYLMKGEAYQQRKIEKALSLTKSRRNAVDVGAHVGLIAMQIAQRFENVYCFEPQKELAEAFHANTDRFKNCHLAQVALGAEQKEVMLECPPGMSGRVFISYEGTVPARQTTLDDCQLEDIDFIKIDVEGYELEVLKGAVGVLKKYAPVLLVESRDHGAERFNHITELSNFLAQYGYVRAANLDGDYVFVNWTIRARPKYFDEQKPTAILGGGYSARTVDLVRLQKSTNLVSINDSIKRTPSALAFFTLDGTYFTKGSDPYGNFIGDKYVALPQFRFRELGLDTHQRITRYNRLRDHSGLSSSPLTINGGAGWAATSGRGALNLVWQWGAKVVLLIGFDNGPIPPEQPTHWHRRSNHLRWGTSRCSEIAEAFDEALPQLRDTGTLVINCSLKSTITCFVKAAVEEFI